MDARDMSNMKVQVTFSAPLIFLSSDQWTQIRTAISAQLPLRDAVWKSSLRPAVRTISELGVELVGLETIRDELTSQVPQTLLEKPFLNIYIVTCDDTDMYKNAVRKQIKDWHTAVTQRKNQEWLILLVVRPDARATAGSFFAMKSSVLDRIKADFNSGRRDRCVQIVWSQGAITPTACADLTAKMKEGIMAAFDSAVMQRSEEVRRSESQRQMPGWNFCTFFILKESIASSFVGMNLIEDAILTYSELEASFLQTQTSSLSGQKTISWFGKLINPDSNDDSLPLLEVGKKPYRDLILNNTISVFDFRVYLLAKHCEALGMSGRLGELVRKAASFLGGFGQRLKGCDASLPGFFVESWIFSAASNVVSESDKWADLFELDVSTLASFHAAKGEILELARIQLDKIGIGVGHLPHTTPFSISLTATSTSPVSDSPEPSPIESAGQITNTDLLAGLTDRDVFDKLYIDTTNRAIDMYIKGARRKFALKLHGSLAALDLHRGRHAQAHQTYSSLPAHYTPHSWTSLATFMQARRLDTHLHLGKPHSREWIDTVLAFLKGFVEEGMHDGMGLLGRGDMRAYVTGLIEEVRRGGSELDGDIVMVDHPMFSVSIHQNTAIHANDQDGSFLNIDVRNALPCEVVVDNIRLFLSGRDSERLEFTTASQTLPPGTTTLTVFCPNPASGLFVLDVSEVSMSAVKLQWSHQSPASHTQHMTPKHHPSLVRIPRDFRAVDIQVESPMCIQLDAPQSLLLTLRSGRNKIRRGIIKLSSVVGVGFQTENAEVTLSEGASVECTEESLNVSNLEMESQIQIRVPHTYHAAAELLKVVVELDYHTSEGDLSVPRHAHFTRHITTTLPLMIQAQDHFRGKSLISNFTISTSPGTYQHLRISSVRLDSIDDAQGGLVITGCRPAKRVPVTVTPTQPAHFLFRIDSDSPRSAYVSMHLHITYRLLREEIERLVTAHVSSALQTLSLSQDMTSDIKDPILKALENDGTWLERYNTTNELHVNSSALKELPDVCDSLGLDNVRKVIDIVVESLRNNLPTPSEVWREVIVPVDLPFKNIVSSARIHIHRTTSATDSVDASRRPLPLYAGQPIAATLTMENSFHWGGPGLTEGKCYSMRFDIVDMGKDWLISGRKKGDYEATDGSVHSIPLTLIPLHHGELSLPQVNIRPLPLTSGEVTMGSMALPSAETYQAHGAERVLVLPRGGRTTFVVDMGEG
ncbi:trafficking protein particle complex subunit 10 [Gautieria morchelliformis]|nr:trafficking protein particle complex subunit 10 [Gautieria morchelliformis]